jgi:hypothetical protein
MSQRSFRRRKIVVDASLQFGLAFRMLGWIVAYGLGFVALVSIPVLWQGVTGTSGQAYEDFLDRVAAFTGFDVLALVLVAALFILHGVAFTHRLAGPIHRFKSILSEITEGRIPDFDGLRKADYMKDLAHELVELCAAQRKQAIRQRLINSETQKAARRLLSAAGHPDFDPEELVLLAHKVLSSAERLDRHIPFIPNMDSQFSLENTTETDALGEDNFDFQSDFPTDYPEEARA